MMREREKSSRPRDRPTTAATAECYFIELLRCKSCKSSSPSDVIAAAAADTTLALLGRALALTHSVCLFYDPFVAKFYLFVRHDLRMDESTRWPSQSPPPPHARTPHPQCARRKYDAPARAVNQ